MFCSPIIASYLQKSRNFGTVVLALLIAQIQTLVAAEITAMRTVGKDECTKIITESTSGVSSVLPATDIDLFKVKYETTNWDGSSVTVSGLYAKPSGVKGDGTLLYFHGTVTGRGDVPSQEYNMLETCIYAGQGFAFLAADYVGLGDSNLVEPYIHKETTVTAGLDLAVAVGSLEKLDSRLFIAGYSQGGHGAMSATRQVDMNGLAGFEFVASTPGAGPYYLHDLLFKGIVKKPDPKLATMHVGKTLRSYMMIYPKLLDGEDVLIQPAFDETLDLLDGTKTRVEVLNTIYDLPHDVIIKADYLERLIADDTMPWAKALIENSVTGWPAKVATTVFYPGGDITIDTENSTRIFAELQAAGAKQVELINIGDQYGHVDGYPTFVALSAKKLVEYRER